MAIGYGPGVKLSPDWTYESNLNFVSEGSLTFVIWLPSMFKLRIRSIFAVHWNGYGESINPSLVFFAFYSKISGSNSYLKILGLANLFVADTPMKKKSFTSSQSTLKYLSKKRPWTRGLRKTAPSTFYIYVANFILLFPEIYWFLALCTTCRKEVAKPATDSLTFLFRSKTTLWTMLLVFDGNSEIVAFLKINLW